MSWRKLGQVYAPHAEFDWMESHAQLPVALPLDDGTVRVYFAGRNEANMSQTGYVNVNLDTLTVTSGPPESPILELGPLGTFDDSGVYPSSVVRTNDEVRLYYIGWMQGKRVPYYASVGLATSTDGGETFEKYSRGPHLPRNDVDPYMTLSSCVRRDDGRWRIWYTTATNWEESDDHPRPNYHIKYAESADGLDWERSGTVAIDYEYDDEWAIASPTVRRTTIGGYEMWYSYVVGDAGYRIGYAESNDGIEWDREDSDVGIEPSKGDWDAEMQAYPNVFHHDGDMYMLYNGNDFGEDGFGIAVREP